MSGLQQTYHYHTIFSDVCKTRFRRLSMRFLLTLSLSVATTVLLFAWLFFGQYSLGRVLFINVPVYALLTYLPLLAVIVARKKYMHVEFGGYRNLPCQIYHQLVSIKCASLVLTYTMSSILLASVLDNLFGESFSELYVVNPHYTFNHRLYYRFVVWVSVPVFYVLQHLVFDLDRLVLSTGGAFVSPKQYIAGKLVSLVPSKLVVLVGFQFIGTPVLYYLFVVQCGLFLTTNSFSFGLHIKLVILSAFIFGLWEITNVAFNGYLGMGCLHKGQPISSLSSNPVDTLVSGLKSESKFTKLAAFQEFSYRATANDVNQRTPIYRSQHKNMLVSSQVLKACLEAIDVDNQEVVKFLAGLQPKKEPAVTVQSSVQQQQQHPENLFGREPAQKQGLSMFSQHRLQLNNDNVLLNPGSKKLFTVSTVQNNNQFEKVVEQLSAAYKKLQEKYKDVIAKSDVSVMFKTSKRRSAEQLVRTPTVYAECVIGLMGLMINSLDEDPKGGVVSSVGDVLKSLERSVAVLGEYTDLSKSENEENVIGILYDLSINAFLEIVLKYNELLNDIYLDKDVIKLSKWVLQVVNEE